MTDSIAQTANVYDDPADEITLDPLPTKIPLPEGIDLEDGRTYDEEPPGEDASIAARGPIRIMGEQSVSDIIVFGQLTLEASAEAFTLIPRHRDRIRVTLQAVGDPATVCSPILGNGYDVRAANGWNLVPNGAPITFDTKSPIFCSSTATGDPVIIQWAIELREEK